MAEKTKEHKQKREMVVPGEIFLAVTTNRTEFMTLLRRQVEAGTKAFSGEEALGICDMAEEAIQMRHDCYELMLRIRRELHNIKSASQGSANLADKFMNAIDEWTGAKHPEEDLPR